MLAKKGLMTAPAAVAQYVEDVFSTYLYTGNGSSQTITNGIDLSGEGGLVWTKQRDSTRSNRLVDTVRGATYAISSNTDFAQAQQSSGLTAFNSNGYSLGSDTDYNTNASTFVGWTFRKAEKFFDVVTFSTTTSSTAPITVNHNLGSVPGCIIVKQTNGTADWFVYHRSPGSTKYLALNSTDMEQNGGTSKWYATPTSTSFTLGGDFIQNANYVAYLFAHDAGGFGDAGSDSIIKCGSFTTDGSAIATVDLGWEPQWILYKASSATQNWEVYDNMRGMTATAGNAVRLAPNLSDAEVDFTGGRTTISSTGFSVNNLTSTTYVYIAIRRGPMKTPEAGTEVFKPVYSDGSSTPRFSTGFNVDLGVLNDPGTGGASRIGLFVDRLRGSNKELRSTSTAVEATSGFDPYAALDYSNGWATTFGSNWMTWNFKRAPGFFDIVTYTGTGSNRTVSHNLGVAPELIIVKRRSGASQNWAAYASPVGNTKYLRINENIAAQISSTHWNDTSPTSSVFTVGSDNDVNSTGATYISYLFGSVSGVSKVGSYTGTGTTLQVNCGFTSGARFVLIKRTEDTGDWYVWDTARGIISGNDPYLLLNSTSAEVTNTDYIDTYSAGFEISSTAPAAINQAGEVFIYLAIA